jgi:hypothetical protein
MNRYNERDDSNMSRKLYAAFVPVLAAVAFMVVPALAQAAPQWYKCEKVAGGTGNYTKINCATEKAGSNFEKVLIGDLSHAVLALSKNVPGTVAELEVPALGGGVLCKKIEDESYLWNRAGSGRDINEVLFTECEGTGTLAGCVVAEPIEVEAYTELLNVGPPFINRFYPVGGSGVFTVLVLEGCPFAGAYPVTGTVDGEIAEGEEQVQKFTEGTLKLGENEATFKAKTEQVGAAKEEGIFVK